MADTVQLKGIELPPELKEQILSELVDDFDDDPAQQWMLRHLSHHQKHRVEQRFRDFWLPKLIITQYLGASVSIDYTLVRLEKPSVSASDADELDYVAHFQATLNPLFGIKPEYLLEMWKQHSVENPNAHLRLGEGLLNDGFRGGYIINDTELPGLQVDESGTNIRFDWHGAFNALLREEIMLRKVHDKMIAEKTAEWKLENDWPASEAIPTDVHMMFLCKEIQMARRVAVREHRIRHYDPSGETKAPFHALSKHLHGQIPTRTEGMPDGGCFCCSRKAGPDIFEVICQEESMVALYPGWKSLDFETLLDLYAEEFGWECYLVRGSKNIEIQKVRKEQWKEGSKSLEWLKQNHRWDILG